MDKKKALLYFSQNLKRWLVKRKKTQAELANFCDVTRATVTLWVKGLNRPKLEKINQICDFLNISRDELLSDPSQPKKDDFKIHFFEGYDYDKLPEAKKEKIRQLIKQLLDE